MVGEIGVGIQDGAYLEAAPAYPDPLLYAEVVSVAVRPRPRSALIYLHRLAR